MAPESPPENWFEVAEEEAMHEGPDGNGKSGSKDGQDEEPDEGDPGVAETTGSHDDGDGFTLVSYRRRR